MIRSKIFRETLNKLGYKDSGGFITDIPGYEQPMEMIMIKEIQGREHEQRATLG